MSESRPAAAAADPPKAGPGLPPDRQAYSAYVRHSLECEHCQRPAGQACAEADRLWLAYRQVRRGVPAS